MSNLIRFNDPFAGLTSLHSQLDDMFNTMFSGMPSVGQQMPAIDVYTEDDKKLVTEVHAPGFDKDEIEVSVHNGVLEIKGEHKEKSEDKAKKRNYMVHESHSSFYRRLALPKHADGDMVKAHFNKGVLTVEVPFKELPTPKKIEIGDK